MRYTMNRKQTYWAYEKWCEGYTLSQIAESLFVDDRTISRRFKSLNLTTRIRPILTCPDEVLYFNNASPKN